MSDQGFADFFEVGAGGAPGCTWKSERKGAFYEGVIVPFDLTRPSVGHETTHKTNTKGEALYWNPTQGATPKILTADEVARTGKDANPVTQAEITILTEYRNNEFMTSKRVERMEENDEKDDGLRRIFVTGPSMPKALRDAMAKAGTRKPEVGAKIKVTLVNKVSNEHGGETNIVSVDYTRPNAETTRIAENYISENAPEDDDDPFTTPDEDTEAPPF